MTKQVHSDTYPAIDPTKLPKPFTARAVFITGASRGIGKAIALSFAKGGASKIAIGARADLSSLAEELKAAATTVGRDEPQVLCVEIEVSDAKSVEAAAASIGEAFGRCDVVVQNAGVFGTASKIADADPDEWWRVYEVNVKGQFLVAKYFLPLLIKSRGLEDFPGLGTFVTTSSVGAHLINPNLSQYQPGKLLNLRLAEHIDKVSVLSPYFHRRCARLRYSHSMLLQASQHAHSIYRSIVSRELAPSASIPEMLRQVSR